MEIWSVPVCDCDNFMYDLPLLPVQSAILTSWAAAGFLLCIRVCGKASYALFAGAAPGVLYSQFVQLLTFTVTCLWFSVLLWVFPDFPNRLCELN